MIGLKRRGFPLKTRKEFSKAFKLVYRSNLRLEEALQKIENEIEPLPEILHSIQFCKESKRGLMGLQVNGHLDEDFDKIEKKKKKNTPQ